MALSFLYFTMNSVKLTVEETEAIEDVVLVDRETLELCTD